MRLPGNVQMYLMQESFYSRRSRVFVDSSKHVINSWLICNFRKKGLRGKWRVSTLKSIDFKADKASTFHLQTDVLLRESRVILSFGLRSKWYGRNLHFNACNIFRVSREVFSTSFHICRTHWKIFASFSRHTMVQYDRLILYLVWNIAIRIDLKKLNR